MEVRTFKVMNRKLIMGIAVVGTAIIATINVVLNETKVPDVSNWTLQKLESFTEESGSGESGGGNSIADDANNSSGWLWKAHYYDCVIKEKIVITSSCGTFYAGATYYGSTQETINLISQITACGAQYTRTVDETGVKKYCFDGWSFCISNTNCY
jgi:hypothetical protein